MTAPRAIPPPLWDSVPPSSPHPSGGDHSPPNQKSEKKTLYDATSWLHLASWSLPDSALCGDTTYENMLRCSYSGGDMAQISELKINAMGHVCGCYNYSENNVTLHFQTLSVKMSKGVQTQV